MHLRPICRRVEDWSFGTTRPLTRPLSPASSVATPVFMLTTASEPLTIRFKPAGDPDMATQMGNPGIRHVNASVPGHDVGDRARMETLLNAST